MKFQVLCLRRCVSVKQCSFSTEIEISFKIKIEKKDCILLITSVCDEVGSLMHGTKIEH